MSTFPAMQPSAEANHEFVTHGVAWVRRVLTDCARSAEQPEMSRGRKDRRTFLAPWGERREEVLARQARGGLWQPAAAPKGADRADTARSEGPGIGNEVAGPDMGDPWQFDGPAPALVSLSERFRLNHFERDILLLCMAVELDPSIRELCARIHGSPARRYPSFAIAMMTLPDPVWTALSPEGPLRALRLIEVGTSATESLVTAPLRMDERLVNHIRGHDHLDERLRVGVLPEDPVGVDSLPPSQQVAAQQVINAWTGPSSLVTYVQRPRAENPLVPDPPAAELVGPDERACALLATAVADVFGLQCYRIEAAALPTDETQLEELASLWRREAGLSPVALLIDSADDHQQAVAFTRRSRCACFIQLRQTPEAPTARAVRVDVGPPTVRERRAAWEEHLPAESDLDPGKLAAQFAVDTVTIARIATEAADPWSRCRAEARPRLDGLVKLETPEASWSDLVLEDAELALLHAIADQMRHRWQVYYEWHMADRASRGLGIAALFTGPSGTGKTLAAEVLANDLNLDLYKADLSGIVSKYIGETEKNLRKLFDAAEAGGGLLFIDEADALLGKRSEVRDSHDRFANIQINYLLQRMESYQGLAILSTNMRSALDSAFMRRLRFIVEFQFPEPAQRAAIWRATLPRTVPGVADLDLDQLAALPLNGGMIRNVAVNAVFLAAAKGTGLTRDHVLKAISYESAKLQTPIGELQLAGEPVTP